MGEYSLYFWKYMTTWIEEADISDDRLVAGETGWLKRHSSLANG